MDGIAGVAKQQQTSMGSGELQAKASKSEQSVQQVEQPKVDLVKEMQQSTTQKAERINSKEQVDQLVQELNNAMAPMNTNLKFGVDQQDVFFVSVIEAQTNKMIRRFPAEQAAEFLPKMKEVTGILFDSKG